MRLDQLASKNAIMGAGLKKYKVRFEMVMLRGGENNRVGLGSVRPGYKLICAIHFL